MENINNTSSQLIDIMTYANEHLTKEGIHLTSEEKSRVMETLKTLYPLGGRAEITEAIQTVVDECLKQYHKRPDYIANLSNFDFLYHHAVSDTWHLMNEEESERAANLRGTDVWYKAIAKAKQNSHRGEKKTSIDITISVDTIIYGLSISLGFLTGFLIGCQVNKGD